MTDNREQQADLDRQAEAERQLETKGLSGVEGAVPPEREASFLNLRTILIASAGLVGMIVFVHVLSLALFGLFTAASPVSERQGPTLVPPEPRLQVDPVVDLEYLQATQQAKLSGYGWVNEEAGVARIPIERAMQIITDRGLPVVTPFPTSAQTQPAEEGGVSPTQGPPAGSAETQPVAGEGSAESGTQLFAELGCNACHQPADSPTAPSLHGIYGQPVELEGGETITADDSYLRESIINPNAHIVAGYPPIMPSFAGRVNDQQLNDLIAYIRSLGGQ